MKHYLIKKKLIKKNYQKNIARVNMIILSENKINQTCRYLNFRYSNSIRIYSNSIRIYICIKLIYQKLEKLEEQCYISIIVLHYAIRGSFLDRV